MCRAQEYSEAEGDCKFATFCPFIFFQLCHIPDDEAQPDLSISAMPPYPQLAEN